MSSSRRAVAAGVADPGGWGTPECAELPRLEDQSSARDGAILALVVVTQLMIVLDASVVNLSLAALRADLHVSSATLAWIVSAYALTFGGLLLLGGRLGDGLGRRGVFAFGVGMFAAASLAAGLSSNAGLLIAARGIQGAAAAVAAPSGLAILIAVFPEGPRRTRALGRYFAMAAAGGALGLLLGGTLTSAFSWRAAFLINVPVGAVVVVGALRWLPRFPGRPQRFDVGGAMTGTLGIGALVFGFIRAGQEGWGQTVGTLLFAAAFALLGAFCVCEQRVNDPVLPLRVLTHRKAAAAYSTMLIVTSVLFGISFLLPQYLQEVLNLAPVTAGVAFLPMPICLFASSRYAGGLVERRGARSVILLGLAAVAVASAWLTRLSATSHYLPGVVGPLVLIGLGGGLLFLPLSNLALSGVPTADAGAASGALQTSQQVGGALGVAVLTAILTASAGAAPTTATFSHAVANAFIASCGLALGGAMIIASTLRGDAEGKGDSRGRASLG